MLVAKKLKLKKNKSKPKRQRTFTSSELSLPEQSHHSLSELFRNDAFKRRPAPPPAPTAVPVKKQRSQKQLNCTKKRGKSRSRTRLDRCETYEVIPYKNSFKSDIVFSNEDTKREGWPDHRPQELAIRLNQKYLADNNQLRLSIRREYQRKVDAAIKIQKVFRGFLTRRVLQHCMENEQRRLQQRLTQIKSKMPSGSISEHSSYFADKQNYSAQPRRRAVDPQDLPESPHHSSSSSDDEAVYRHHEAIYSHEEIGEFASSEEEDFDQDAFDNHIIFETNEEYIDSRKSSQQPQPKNKLSRSGHPHPIAEEPIDQPEPLDKTEKKQERSKCRIEEQEEIREVTLKLNEERGPQKPMLMEREGQATMKGLIESQVQVERLKEEQVCRWDEIIGLVQSQMTRSDNSQFATFMQQIMHLSLKNKQMLELGSPKKSQASLPRLDSKEKLKSLKADRHYLIDEVASIAQSNPQDQNINANTASNLPKSQLIAQPLFEPVNAFQKSGQLRRLLSPPDDQAEEMLRMREELMKKREVEEMRRLNLDLQAKSISQEAFLDRLQAIQNKYTQEKASIERTREDISKGHKAALQLAQQAATDAKKLGYDLPLSRSAEGLRHKHPLPNILIDELPRIRKEDRPRQMLPRPPQLREDEGTHINLSSDAESSDLQSNEDYMWRFRRAQPDLELTGEIADLGRNVMISEELLRQQQAEESLENQLMMTQHVCKEVYEIEEVPAPRCSPRAQQLVQWLTAVILWEVTGELLLRPLFAERLLEKSHLLRPTAVTDQERLLFLSLLEENFPSTIALNAKLNQKICPLPTELLRCMRIDFSQEEDDNSYEQIGKYEFIIGQEVCNTAIQKFRAAVDAAAPLVAPAVEEIEKLSQQYCFSQKLSRYLLQREKYTCNRRNHTRELRWQVLNIEIHCIFDAWNQELIALRSQKAGYSGIGLNELTLSVQDHNSILAQQQTLPIISEGKQKLIRTLSLSSPALVFPKAVEEDEEMLELDSRWIFYADEALSYGLQLVYLVQEEIFNEMGKEIRKRMLQF